MTVRRAKQSAECWQALLDKQAQSGLSVSAFCTREQLSVASFYQWRSRLNRRPSSAPSAVGREGAFVDLGALSGNARLELRIDLGGGMVLHLARG